MGAFAASGGYMISAPAEHIVAEPSTLTGSIGVIAQLPNISGTLDKIGMGMQVVKSTHARVWKDQLSPFRAPKDYEKQHLVDILNAYQNDFETIVRNGRGKRLVTKEEDEGSISTQDPRFLKHQTGQWIHHRNPTCPTPQSRYVQD